MGESRDRWRDRSGVLETHWHADAFLKGDGLAALGCQEAGDSSRVEQCSRRDRESLICEWVHCIGYLPGGDCFLPSCEPAVNLLRSSDTGHRLLDSGGLSD